MKGLICIIIVCLSGFVGHQIAKNYVVRDLFFKEMIELFNFVKNNIGFKKTKLDEIFTEYENICDKRFIKHIKAMKKLVIKNENIKITDMVDFYFLTKEEKLTIIKYLNELGTSNDYIECINIDNFLKSLENYKNACQEKRRKNEALVYKLSVSVGLVISILIV